MKKQLQYDTLAQDWIVAADWFVENTRKGRATLRRAFLLWIAITSLLAMILGLWHLALGAAVLVLIWTFTLVMGKGSIIERLKGKLVRVLARRSNKGQNSRCRRVQISEINLIIETDGLDRQQRDWNHLKRLDRTDEGLVLLFDADRVLFLPSRGFESAEALVTFSQECESHLSGTARMATPKFGGIKNDSGTTRNAKASAPLGILSLLTGSIAIASSCLPIVGLVSGGLAMGLGIVASSISRRQQNHRGLGMSLSGIAAGGVAICIALLLGAAMGSYSSFAPFALFRSLRSVVDVPVLSALDDVQAAINAAAIANACATYAKAHNDRYPPHLAVLVIEGTCDVETLHVPGGKANAIDTSSFPKSEADWPTVAATVESGSDFEYVGADLPPALHGDESKLIIVYSKATLHDGSRVCGFADGTAKSLNPTECTAAAAKSNEARKALDLPPVNFAPY